MNRILAKLTVLTIAVLVLVLSLSAPAFAAERGVIMVSANKMKTGDEINVSATFTSSDTVKTVSGKITFDNKLFKYKSGGVACDGGEVTLKSDVTGSNTIITVTFIAVAPGSGGFVSELVGEKADGTKTNPVRNGTSNKQVVITGDPVNATDNAPATGSDLDFVYGDQTFTIINDIENIPQPNKFIRTVTKYNDLDINTITDENGKYALFYVFNAGAAKNQWFYLTSEAKLEPLEYIVINDQFYIIEIPDTENKTPDGDWKTGKYTVPATGVTVDCFESKKSIMSDFYIFLCYIDGESRYYRYDSLTGVIQREPDFALIEVQPVKTEAKTGMINNLANFSPEAKTLIFLAGLEMILIVVLVILLIIKGRKATAPFQEDEIV